ncbi:hypothetical protein GBAR_LOCUS24093 [Geodia barretti]|nr:hypothetical protein GBAR_LOCUS24093 [Geodia barretti]
MSPSDKNESAKLAALGAFQEAAPKLLNDAIRLESTVTSLKTIFYQSRTSASSLVLSQILCTMTSILIEMEAVVEGDYLLSELVQILSEVVEKVETEGYHHLVRATACDCLREIELAFPVRVNHSVILDLVFSEYPRSCSVFSEYPIPCSVFLGYTELQARPFLRSESGRKFPHLPTLPAVAVYGP